MAIQMGKALAFTAVGGLVAGFVGCGGDQKGASGAPAPSGDPTAMPAEAKSCCAGKNPCAGKGGCKTADNGCAGKNTCKHKGGCKTGQCE
jgi:hypothetical protein